MHPVQRRCRTALGARFAALLLSFGLCACTGAGGSRAAGDPLFGELGGLPGVTAVVDGLLFAISEDRRIAHHFAESNILRLREKLIEQICMESGGPCTYTGDSMQQSHAGRGFTQADFNALVECLQVAMREQGVSFRAQNQLLARLAPMQRDILYR